MRLLLVEDDELLVASLRKELEQQGFAVGRMNGRSGDHASGCVTGSKNRPGKVSFSRRSMKWPGCMSESLVSLFQEDIGNPIAASIPISAGVFNEEAWLTSCARLPSIVRREMVRVSSRA